MRRAQNRAVSSIVKYPHNFHIRNTMTILMVVIHITMEKPIKRTPCHKASLDYQFLVQTVTLASSTLIGYHVWVLLTKVQIQTHYNVFVPNFMSSLLNLLAHVTC